MELKVKKRIARYIGNWGVSFFTPLVGGNLAESVFDIGISFEHIIIIAAIASTLNIGMLVSLDIKKWSERNGKKTL